MTVKQLRDRLEILPQDAQVILSNDEEGNGFSILECVQVGRYNKKTGDYGLAALTPELENEGYTKEDVVDGPLAVCLWP